MLTLWQLVITGEMIGLEANITLEVILMIANIQTLGVPIRYASIPGTVAAAFGLFLIPVLGLVLDRWAKSKRSKAKILGFTTLIQLVGSLCVLLANGIKLAVDHTNTSSASNGSTSGNITDLFLLDNLIGIELTNSTSDLYSESSLRSTETFSDYFWPGLLSDNQSSILTTLSPFTNQTFAPARDDSRLSYPQTTPGPSATEERWTTTAQQFQEDLRDQGKGGYKEEGIPFYAYIAMVGYCMLDCGYDSSNCFLKTFVLHCTPPEHHVSIIVKSIMVSSVGGVLVSILGSVDLGETLTAGTGYDSNSALVCLIAAISSLLLFLGTLATFITGFYWKYPDNRVGTAEEKARLIASTTHELDTSQRQERMSTSQRSKGRLEHSYSRLVASTSLVLDKNQIVDAIRLEEPRPPGILGFIHRQKRMILVNFSAFFMLSSLYSFEVFVVNFLGMAVFEGDPSARTGSEKYESYLDGVSLGSQGTLIYYILFAITSFLHEKSLAYFERRKEYRCCHRNCRRHVAMWLRRLLRHNGAPD
ncbi:sucrose transport protein [Plakobranchus ocellatus]|uniref:Sucrose transport protein n=1 Tax=Plakobranchus ocellatus TaxID=259542 RepID=A0AAV4BKT6_9GAST|nr:sucrose transport protein [Plakobranchus ocellatus]